MRGHVASWGGPRRTARVVRPAAGPSALATAMARVASVAGGGADGEEYVAEGQAGRRPLGHGDRDGPLSLDDRARVVRQQLAVQDRDLPPVGVGGAGGGRVGGGDRRPELVRARPPHPQRVDQEAFAFLDHALVPAGPVLLL